MWDALELLSTEVKEKGNSKRFYCHAKWVEFKDDSDNIWVSSNSTDPVLNCKMPKADMFLIATVLVPIALEFFDGVPRVGA